MQRAKPITGPSSSQPSTNQKIATRNWLSAISHDYPVAMTFTLKQTEVRQTPCGTHIHRLERDDVERIAARLIQKLNREVFGKRAAEKYQRTLKFIVVVEGERSKKRLHLHLAVGGFPEEMRYSRLDSIVVRAKSRVDQIDQQYKVDLADSGWMEYISKELSARDTDNVLWALC